MLLCNHIAIGQVRNYSGVFHFLYKKYAVKDPANGLTRQEFCDMCVAVGNEDLDEDMAGGMFDEVTYDEDNEVEEEDLRMNVHVLSAGLVRVANQLIQMLGADEASGYDAIAGQLKWFIGTIAEKLGLDATHLTAVAALPVRGPEFFSYPQSTTTSDSNGEATADTAEQTQQQPWKGSTSRCFLDLWIDGASVGKVIVELDTERTPKTAFVFNCQAFELSLFL